MGMAAFCDQFDCNDCGWRWFVDAPKGKFGAMNTPTALPYCPQCSSKSVRKS